MKELKARREPTILTLELPLPPSALSPNSRCHWATKARAVKKYRSDAALIAGLSVGKPLKWAAADVHVIGYFRTAARRDGDNFTASLKAAFDGLADAGIVANDCGFRHYPPELKVDKSNPRVVILIESR